MTGVIKKQCDVMVELVGRYSKLAKPPELPQFLGVQYGQIERIGQGRVHAVVRRLEIAVIEQLVRDYEAGVETPELTGRYGLGKGTVLKLLREHGVTMRRQGLSSAEIDEAIQLHAEGWSLARIGQQFGRAHTVIRKALLDQGVPLRPRNGWPH